MKKILIFLFVSLFFLFKPHHSFAEVIHNFDTKIVAQKNGEMNIEEKITYDFETSNRHGIFRNIPLVSKVGDLYRVIQIKNIKVLRNGERENYKLNWEKNNLNIKIGNADRLINGSHLYTISYTVLNGIGSNYEDHDEIYWNSTGNSWEVNIEKAQVLITTGFDLSQKELICFTGEYGSKLSTCEVKKDKIFTTNILYPGDGLTFVAVYPVGSFPKSVLVKEPPTTVSEKIFNFIISNYFAIFALINFGISGALIYWYLKHKNKSRFGKSSVSFDFPKDDNGKLLSPALSGTIDTAKLEKDDVIATIFDLAIRKYIKIEQVKTTRKFLPDSSDQKIIKLKNADSKLESFEKTLLNRLFEDGDTVNIKDLRLDFYKTFFTMEDEVFKALISKKLYAKNPKAQKSVLFVLAIICLSTGNFILALVLIFLFKKLNGRTQLGDEIDFKIDGLKLFLKSMDRNYKWQAEKLYVVEKMIPYAVALGFIDEFMAALKIYDPNYQPSWYAGYRGSFFVNYSVFNSSFNSNITTAAPSSSGSSGGFSGGGGGGGGGGSW